MGICLVPKVTFFGFGQEGSRFEQHVTAAPEPDRVIYSLKKFLSLLVKGNPTILNLVFADESVITHTSEYGDFLRSSEVREALICQPAAGAYLGYMTQQIKKLEKHGTGEALDRIKRPELVEEFGFDTKYAMHALRLGYQGCELLETGTISFPMEDTPREWLMQVRQGEVNFDYVMAEAKELMRQLELLKNDNVLRPEPMLGLASLTLFEMQQEFWNRAEPLHHSFY